MRAGNLLIGSLFGGLALADAARQIVARNLLFWMEEREMTGGELARQMAAKGYAVTRQTISNWTRASVKIDVDGLEAAAAVLEVPMGYLVHEDSSGLPDPRNNARIKTDESERCLRFIAGQMGFEVVRLRRKEKT